MVEYPTSRDRHGGTRHRHRPTSNFRMSLHLTCYSFLDLDIAELRTPLSDELLAELAWEEEMVCNTKRLYDM